MVLSTPSHQLETVCRTLMKDALDALDRACSNLMPRRSSPTTGKRHRKSWGKSSFTRNRHLSATYCTNCTKSSSNAAMHIPKLPTSTNMSRPEKKHRHIHFKPAQHIVFMPWQCKHPKKGSEMILGSLSSPNSRQALQAKLEIRECIQAPESHRFAPPTFFGLYKLDLGNHPTKPTCKLNHTKPSPHTGRRTGDARGLLRSLAVYHFTSCAIAACRNSYDFHRDHSSITK